MDGIKKFAGVLTNPKQFYKSVVKEKGFKAPLQFFAWVMALSAIVSSIAQLPSTVLSVMQEPELQGTLGLTIFVIAYILFIGFIIIFEIGFVFISAGILHLFLQAVGAKRGYYETIKIVCYASIPYLFLAPLSFFTIIPKVGSIVYFGLYLLSWLWSAIIQVHGAVVVHKINYTRAIIALIAIPIVIVSFITIMVVMFFAALAYYLDMSSITGYIINSVV